MPIMFCYIDPFAIDQKVYELNEETKSFTQKAVIPLIDIIRYIAEKSNNYKKIIISSDSTEMSHGYVEQIKDFIYFTYGKNNDNIEVI